MRSQIGFDSQRALHLNELEIAVAGAVSGALTRLVCQPLDVLKIRFQLQVEPISRQSSSSKYRGILQATRTIVREEGVLGLWKGHVPAQALSVVYGVVQFVTFDILTRKFQAERKDGGKRPRQSGVHTICGGLAGFAASLAAFPIDTVRTRLVAQGHEKNYRNISHAVHTMLRNEGPTSFYKGLLPGLLQIMPYVGLQFGFYSFLNHEWETIFGVGIYPNSRSLACGALAGTCAKIIIYPLDVVKKRLQIQGFARRGFSDMPNYSGLIHCLASIAKAEGVRGFFKGLSPSLLKATCTTALNFYFYELCAWTLLARKASSREDS